MSVVPYAELEGTYSVAEAHCVKCSRTEDLTLVSGVFVCRRSNCDRPKDMIDPAARAVRDFERMLREMRS